MLYHRRSGAHERMAQALNKEEGPAHLRLVACLAMTEPEDLQSKVDALREQDYADGDEAVAEDVEHTERIAQALSGDEQ